MKVMWQSRGLLRELAYAASKSTSFDTPNDDEAFKLKANDEISAKPAANYRDGEPEALPPR